MKQTNQKLNNTAIILGLLLLVAIIGGGFMWSQNKGLDSTNKELNSQVATLTILKKELVNDIESLQDDYATILSENEELAALVETTTKKVDEQKVAINKIKQSAAKDAAGMKTEIDQLQSIKKEMNAFIARLQAENATLKADNEELTNRVTDAEAKNMELEFQISQLKQMTGQLEKDKSNLMATATRATDLRIDIRKKGDKPTGSFRRARAINVSFAISSIPAEKKGDHKLYVVIKNAKGVPVKVANPIKATIQSNTGGKSEEIIAQQMQVRDLFEKVRLQMSINPEEGSLKAGYYRVSVYADWGLLGGAEFQLR